MILGETLEGISRRALGGSTGRVPAEITERFRKGFPKGNPNGYFG